MIEVNAKKQKIIIIAKIKAVDSNKCPAHLLLENELSIFYR